LERVVRSRAIIDFATDSSPFYAIVGAHHLGLSFPLKQSHHIKIRCGASTLTEASATTCLESKPERALEKLTKSNGI
jgi:hypothetical protein